MRHKFNAILEEILSHNRCMYFANIQKYIRPVHFDRSNYLTASGMTSFWKSVDFILEEFNKHKEKLIPQPVITNFSKQKEKEREPRFPLPKPK